MNFASFMKDFVPSNYVNLGLEAYSSHVKQLEQLLIQKKIPKEGWTDATLEMLLSQLSSMDSNNFSSSCGIGEREGRVFSNLVKERHYRFSHGIGRSGDIAAVQPKAVGSSLLYRLSNCLVLDAIRISGVRSCNDCIVVPVATGMALMLCLSHFRRSRGSARYVLWTRIDQKSCLKCIVTAGCEPFVIEPVLHGDELRTNIPHLEEAIALHGAEAFVCVMSTTSCFSPRAPDDLEAIAKLCAKHNLPHVVNNAYGLQSSKCTHLIEQAARVGRVDVFVQSADKNFMVPVGGAIIAGFDSALVAKIAKAYPGRGSMTPSLDLLLTLLSMGTEQYERLLKQRKETFTYLREQLITCAAKHGERVLDTKSNPISLAMSLEHVELLVGKRACTQLGSMLFTRHCSGARVVVQQDEDTVEGCKFRNFGMHSSSYPVPYLNAAAAIGMAKDEVDLFINRLDKCLSTVLNGLEAPTSC